MLHGSIEINGLSLGGWTARRLSALQGTASVHEYEWTVEVRSLGATRNSRGVLQHRYDDGPAKLAALVLAASLGEET